MAKVISAYNNHTAAQIKSRADIPDVGDMSIVGTTVECSNITTAKIRNGIGAAINSVGALSIHANVNPWSGFGPTVRTYTDVNTLNGVLVNNAPSSNFKMGDFAGYNHSAVAPGWGTGAKTAAEEDIWITIGDDANFMAQVYIGEVDYSVDGETALGVVLTIWDGASLEAFTIYDLATGSAGTYGLEALLSGITSQTTFTGKIFIGNHAALFNANGVNVLCKVPNVTDYTVTVKVKQLNNVVLAALSVSHGWSITGGNFNRTTGQSSFDTAANASNFDNIVIYFKLTNWLGVEIDSDSVAYGAYTGGGGMGFTSVTLNAGAPYAQYGYTLTISFIDERIGE